ncbi:ABC transporter permease [Hymenobacter sp. HSC-4F20]|uniref:ABC transporter permease n=1 Tax=Hymenobacter sp. HSC-4F20 TaxID=2864135 RepID=UPI001C72F90C|nr:ABC transporter permease [Hymenobacter sp. HSC-4F20]MBX0291062.1 ABC transporter permease [Hymenobacter sp. HSC-4F20]
MPGRSLLRYVARTAIAGWLTVSSLFLISRAYTDSAAFLRSSLENSSRPLPAARRARLTQQLLQRYGLDVPLFYITPDSATTWRPSWRWNGVRNQYHRWLTRAVQGDLGTSYRDGSPVTELLARSLLYTLPLTVLAAVCSIGLTWGIVVWMNVRPSWRSMGLLSLHGLQAAPLFLTATTLLLLLANPDVLAWFPAFGLGLEDLEASWWQQPGRLLYFLVLPTLSLVLVTLPGLAVQLDGALQQELHRPYIATARAKGSSVSRVVWHHGLRNALLPTLALLTELLPNLVAGSTVVELLFALPGMGRLLAESAATQDYPVLIGAIGLVALVRLLAQVVADILYWVVDPRIRVQV